MAKVLLFGEPLIRISPMEFATVGDGVCSKLYFGGSEINIACNLQSLGLQTKLMTALPDSEIGNRFLTFLHQYQIDTENISRVGERVGIYYLENGYGCRQSEVFYDRKNTSMEYLSTDMVDIDQLFDQVSHFHFSGITVAIGSSVRAILLELLEEAKRRQITISMDLNLRTKLISIKDAKPIFSKFAQYADYCFGIDPLMVDEQDVEMFSRTTATLCDIEERMRALQSVYSFKTIFHTYRSVDEQGRNVYQAYALGDSFEQSITLKTAIYQRVGSGDAFVSGALYQLLQGADLKASLDFAVASATLKCTVDGDNMQKSVRDIEKVLVVANDVIR